MPEIPLPLAINVVGEPKAQPRPKAFARKMGGVYVARVYTPGTAEAWKGSVAMVASATTGMRLDFALSISMVFFLPRLKSHFNSQGVPKTNRPLLHVSKPDGDNLYKGTIDALQHIGLIANDSTIAHHSVWKCYDTTPGMLMVIMRAEEAMREQQIIFLPELIQMRDIALKTQRKIWTLNSTPKPL